MRNLLVVLSLSFSLAGCNYAHDENIVGNYFVIGTDSKEKLSLSVKLEDDDIFVDVVPTSIKALGLNEEYIIVKQYPKNDVENNFIVKITKLKGLSQQDSLYGPLTESDFLKKKDSLRISQLEFTKFY